MVDNSSTVRNQSLFIRSSGGSFSPRGFVVCNRSLPFSPCFSSHSYSYPNSYSLLFATPPPRTSSTLCPSRLLVDFVCISQLLLLRCSLTHPFPAMMAYCCWFCTVLHFVVKHSFFVCLPVLFVGYCWTRWRQLERQRESCTERTNAIKSSSSASRSLGLFCFGLFCLWFLAHMSLSLPHLSTFVCHILISPCTSSTASCCS